MKNPFFVICFLLLGSFSNADSVDTYPPIKGVINLEAGIKPVHYEVSDALDGQVQILLPPDATNLHIRFYNVTMEGGCSVKMSGNIALVTFGEAHSGQACYLEIYDKGDHNLPLGLLTLYVKTK
jgi:hypothetical protein